MRGLGPALGAALALCSSGCAVLFMDRLPADYDVRTSEPHCSTGMGFVIWDGAITLVDIATVPLLLQRDPGFPDTQKTALLAAVVAEALLHTASAATGASWAKECAEARQQRAAHNRAELNRVKSRRRVLRQRRSATVAPRGFYCASQSCATEKAACEQFRIATGDATACTLVESAFCFAIHDLGVCAPTVEACQRQRALAGSAAESECIPQGEAARTRAPVPAPSPEAEPTGFYCATDVCTRTLESCERHRASAPDAPACTAAASAYCFSVGDAQECRSSLEACQREFATAGDAATSECVLAR